MDKAPDAFRTISEVADDLDVPQHVLRFWETRFAQIKPMKRSGGRRYYRPDDVDLLRGIRRLLYGEGYTIRGVQRILREQGIKAVQGLADASLAPPAATRGAVRMIAPEPDESESRDAIAADDDEELETDDAQDDDEEFVEAEDEPELPDVPEVAVAPRARTAPPAAPDITPRRAPVIAPARDMPREVPRANVSAAPAATARLAPADVVRLKSVLADLMDCKTLVDDALARSAPDLFPLK